MKLTVCSVLLATLLVASTSVESSLDVSPSNHARRHHAKVQNLQKREKFSGQATWYGWNQGDQGACGEFLPQNGFYVALNHGQYGNMNQQSSLCGKTITITNGLKTTQARILDACPGDGSTCKWGALDMSKPLFEFFNPLGVGVFPMSWWVGGDSDGGSSGSSSSSNSNNDDDSSDSDSGSNGAAAAKQAAQDKAAQQKAAQEKADAKKAAAEKAAKEKAAKEKAAAAKKAAAKKAAAKKAAKEKAAKEKAASEKAQHQNIAAFGEIMQTLNQIVENAVVSPSSGAVSVSASSASASSTSSSSKD